LLSDDKRDIPVLAFSEKGEFDVTNFEKLPAGVKDWLSETIMLNNELEINSKTRELNNSENEWDLYLKSENYPKIITPGGCETHFLEHVYKEYAGAMLQTHWHQHEPYNLRTPICNHGQNEGKHKPAGCVAIAVAQVMNFWEYPAGFNWSTFQNYYLPSNTSPSAYAVADFIKDIGSKVFMVYGCEGSSSDNTFAKRALEVNYGYDNGIFHGEFDIDKIRNNLKWGYPVIISGFAEKHTVAGVIWYTDGHAWVADGLREYYDKYKRICYTGAGVPMTDYFSKNYRYYIHMNWGHGSPYQDIWYYSNNITVPTGTNQSNYQWKKDIIVNIHP